MFTTWSAWERTMFADLIIKVFLARQQLSHGLHNQEPAIYLFAVNFPLRKVAAIFFSEVPHRFEIGKVLFPISACHCSYNTLEIRIYTQDQLFFTISLPLGVYYDLGTLLGP